MKVTNLRDSARQIFLRALQAVDARAATQRAITLQNSLLLISGKEIEIARRPIYVVAIGKAATTMAAGLHDTLGERITRGIVCGPAHPDIKLRDWLRFSGGHPLPTAESLAGARAAIRLLSQAEENALVIFLISGGGSAMFELPVNERITLADIQETNRQLISCGASIGEINSVRRACSAVKGGKLAWAAPYTDQITLIISDTNPGDAGIVASGPTIEPDANAPLAAEVLNRYGLKDSLPRSIVDAINENVADQVAKQASPSSRMRDHYVILENRTALKTAALEAQRLGFETKIAPDINEQEIDAGCDLLLTRAHNLAAQNQGKAVCLLSGGEFSCPVRGAGVGGRNLETVLRCLIKLGELKPQLAASQWAVLSAGTDGIDGNSDAAGAVADETTMSQAIGNGVDAASLLENSDAFHFFQKTGDLIITGPTGTNVRDVRLVLVK